MHEVAGACCMCQTAKKDVEALKQSTDEDRKKSEEKKSRGRKKGRIRELEEIRAELAQNELVLLSKERELLERDQSVQVLREEVRLTGPLACLTAPLLSSLFAALPSPSTTVHMGRPVAYARGVHTSAPFFRMSIWSIRIAARLPDVCVDNPTGMVSFSKRSNPARCTFDVKLQFACPRPQDFQWAEAFGAPGVA